MSQRKSITALTAAFLIVGMGDRTLGYSTAYGERKEKRDPAEPHKHTRAKTRRLRQLERQAAKVQRAEAAE